MNLAFQIVLVTVPPIAVLLTAYLVIKSYLDNDAKKRELELKINNQQVITPIRLQAYERITLFLERISPETMMTRVNKKGMTTGDLQTELLSNIRAEYEHNLSQQIYISSKAWDMVKTARNSIIKMINTAADAVDPTSPSLNLSKKIIEMTIQMGKTPSAGAVEYIKEEMKMYF